MRPKKSNFVFFRPELIDDLDDRVQACCAFNLIASHHEARKVLESCAEGPRFYQALVRERLKVTAYPRKKRTLPRKKPYYGTNDRLPSLFPDIPSVADQLAMPAVPQGIEADLDDPATAPISEEMLVGELASATLLQNLAELQVHGDVEEAICTLDLVEGLSSEERARIADGWRRMGPVNFKDNRGDNLFRNFGIDIEGAESDSAGKQDASFKPGKEG